ncbi:DUF6366 family protein [Alkalibacillus aidingensis]|uniref:DUF6366 family protein n=1 Tax=Alkalibacillus aidingensis TaxID=2747607 RepID=UPI00166111BC|nr:DUF6366 family protein [Alkalibacillus aidingensis]
MKESPEERRERLRQRDLKNSSSNVGDSFHRAKSGSLVDLVGALGWKGTGILILIMIVGFIVYSFLN